ncbi:MAG: Rieske 2Fe-2S domain-containing protein [Steroidobacteraceae bacterium]
MLVPAGTVLARLADLPDGATLGFDLTDDEWPMRGFLVRVGAEVHAYLNRCPHAGRQLNFMRDRFLTPDGELIQCVAHGALFEKATGLCIAGPCVDESLRRIAVQLADGEVRLAEELDTDRLARSPW